MKSRRPSIPRRTSSALPIAAGSAILLAGLGADGGDILRGGSFQKGGKGGNRPSVDTPTPAAADTARANARDSLARTSQALKAMQRMQEAARANAAKGPNHLGNHPLKPGVKLPNVPNGLKPGGLVPLGGAKNPSSWVGAKAPEETTRNGKTEVDILQTQRQALLEWETFHLGKDTTLNFNQSRGGENAAQWIAFNKVKDPAANPSQILGKIKADGQVYLINPNGVIFGGASQVNTRGLTVSSLPINDNLVSQGLLNNRDAQFLFSALKVPGGSDGTPDFNPQAPPATGRFGDITVLPGAVIETPASSAGSGGRVMLVAPNVHQKGSILTPSGQTVLAAGLQVGIAAHDANDPSLRGLDVWVGAVDADSGTVNQEGLLQFHEGSASLTGKSINQLGVLESTTTVSLNGRIDINASYGAAANPNFDSGGPGSGGPMFLNQFTGVATFGKNSSVRILPAYQSDKEVPGTELPERSQVNVTGSVIHFDEDAGVLAPNGLLSVRAGRWTYADTDADGTIFDAAGVAEPGLVNHYTGRIQRFLLDGGQIFVEDGALLNVAGSTDVAVPLDHSILTVELRGAELADSPLQREGKIRGAPLTVDIRNTGNYNGRFWKGTPLGDLTGLAGLIQRNAAQLTASGGSITLSSGGSVVLSREARLDVSGGFYTHEGGEASLSSLLSDGRRISLADALPERSYDGVYNGTSTDVHEKWGITRTFRTALDASRRLPQQIEGADAGALVISAPSMALDGEMRGMAVTGPSQRETPPVQGSLSLLLQAEKAVPIPGSPVVSYLTHSPTPPAIRILEKPSAAEVPEFSLSSGIPAALPASRVATLELDDDLSGPAGFGNLTISNPDGEVMVSQDAALIAGPGGSLSLTGANVMVKGSLHAPSGSIKLTAFNRSPGVVADLNLINPPGSLPLPAPVAGKGMVTLKSGARISAAGLLSNDLPGSRGPGAGTISPDGGSVEILSYDARLEAYSVIDVSGSVHVSDRGSRSYGKGGSISITTGIDPGFNGVAKGSLLLESELRGYSGSKGASLSVQATRIRIGTTSDAGLSVDPSFFQQGGFTKYTLTGIGAASDAAPAAGQFESYLPGLLVAEGSRIEPLAESLRAVTDPSKGNRVRLVRFLPEEGARSAASLSLLAIGYDDPFTPDSLEARGDLVLGEGSAIRTDPAASVTLKGDTVTLLGSVTAPGGSVSATGATAFPLTSSQRLTLTAAMSTVHIGDSARISTAGRFVQTPDAFGRKTGRVLGGGFITISGNITAQEGAMLDVSGASEVVDTDPRGVADEMTPEALKISGLRSRPIGISAVPVRIDSDAGSISLAGGQMLLSDATLTARPGGEDAIGGTLSVSSGRFYAEGLPRTGADTNLVVVQSGNLLPAVADAGVGSSFPGPAGNPLGNLGRFALSRFSDGLFDSLILGGNYSTSGVIPFGGNVVFEGPVKLRVPGSLRIAAGGVVGADSTVEINASYLSIGQDFTGPANPNDTVIPFRKDPAIPNANHQFAPVHGAGSLDLKARLVDIGTLSLQGIGRASIDAGKGDIRGNGTMHIAGDLSLSAATIYPVSGADFRIFAYDHSAGESSVTITADSPGKTPLSANGSLAIYASTIVQRGVLRAPFGSITLGWDGTDLDPSDPDLDAPVDLIAGPTKTTPVTSSVILGNRSITSVSALSPAGKLAVPFGISPDGRSWVDPRGVNITAEGLPAKAVSFTGDSITMRPGALVELSGGGDLLASRWVPGNGGSTDLLGAASGAWNAGTAYTAGQLVSHNGQTWSARIGNTGNTPSIGAFWSLVPASFAILPESRLSAAPVIRFNNGPNGSLLDGDPGFTDSSLKVGDTVTIEGLPGLPAGTYTLLPRRFASYDGAWLVTPVSSKGTGVVKTADGASIVSGHSGNRYTDQTDAAVLGRFELAPAKVVRERAEYQTLSASLLAEAQEAPLRTSPDAAGSVLFHGNQALLLAGQLRGDSTSLGARVDISSFSNIDISSGASRSAVGGITLRGSVLRSWNAESLLIGGVRTPNPDGSVTVTTRAPNIGVSGKGPALTARDLVLTAASDISIGAGSRLRAPVAASYLAEDLSLAGAGTLVRVSSDATASLTRAETAAASPGTLTIGDRSGMTGATVHLDSTDQMQLGASLDLSSDTVSLSAGKISLLTNEGVTAPGDGLVLGGATLGRLLDSAVVKLTSYGTIDLVGTGRIGSEDLDLTLSAGSIRGISTGGGNASILAQTITLENTGNGVGSGAPALSSGRLSLDANTIRLGNGSLALSGYERVSLNASARLVAEGNGKLSVTGDLAGRTPLFTSGPGASYSLMADGAVSLKGNPSQAAASSMAPGGSLSIQGDSVTIDSAIVLPAGRLSILATAGDVSIRGRVSADGVSREFQDLTRVAGAGAVSLSALAGDVILHQGSSLSVAADPQGGNAGSVSVSAPTGSFRAEGTLDGSAADDATAASFSLDTDQLTASGPGSLAALNSTLRSGGFTESLNYRIRNGNVLIDHAVRSHRFSLFADAGSLTLDGSIDASGKTGGSVTLAASGNLLLSAGSFISAAGERFNSAGKGGSVLLEAGAQSNGSADLGAVLDIRAGSAIDLSVAELVAGAWSQPGSSAFSGKFAGTLHLRAPRNAAGTDLGIATIAGSVSGASSIMAEGYRIYQPAGGVLNIALRNQIHADNTAFLGAAGMASVNETAIRGRLLAANPGLHSSLVIAPGVEIINKSGDLTLGLANTAGSTNAEALAAADWDLSSFRYGSKSAPGVLTMRASGDLVFNNTLSDGFTPIAQGTAQVFADNGHSLMWLATLTPLTTNLPVNTQSWSYRLTAGADLASASFRSTVGSPDKGSILIGEFHGPVPNNTSSGQAAAIGSNGQTADTVRISTTTTNRGNRFEVLRTGAGDITLTAANDVQLRNQLSSAYSAGVAIPVSTTVFSENDFVVPIIPTSLSRHPSHAGTGVTLGSIQQLYQPVWSMAGGDISITAGRDIGRYTMAAGAVVADASRQIPGNWLYRRGLLDAATGLFSAEGGFGTNPNLQNTENIHDAATSTTWWIDFSNFFQGVGTLGGGNISLQAGRDVVNVDAVAPTNARMAGRTRNPAFGSSPDEPEYINLAPSDLRLVEHGGGDVSVRSGADISGGIYYVERGKGSLDAGGSITTNGARSPSLGVLDRSAPLDPLTWLPTTLFVGKSSFDVNANGDVLIGPVTNPFLLPQGLNNRYWYKTAFSTFSADAGAAVTSLGGNITHRMAVTLPDSSVSRSLLDVWLSTQNLYNGEGSANNASNYQPWTRLVETGLETFAGAFKFTAPNLASTSFSGDISLVGSWTLAPSPTGGLELAAGGDIIGLNPTGPGRVSGRTTRIWTASTVNLSDAAVSPLPGTNAPLAYQNLVGRDRRAQVQSEEDLLLPLTRAITETGSYIGDAAASVVKESLHGTGLLHDLDRIPVSIFALGGDITGLQLFTPKRTRIIAGRDITDAAFYIQNTDKADISLVSAGRDMILYNEGSELRRTASDFTAGNAVGDPGRQTSAGTPSSALAGDIQISGPGILEVLAGGNIDLGNGANFTDGTGVGITSIGNNRNPNLPFAGADLVVQAGLTGSDGGPATGLADSSLDVQGFIARYLADPEKFDSAYRERLGKGIAFEDLSDEQQALVAFERFFAELRQAGRDAAKTGSYKKGYQAVRRLFGKSTTEGELLVRAREVRTVTGGAISIGVPDGGITMASEIFGNPLTPPGIVTEYGGAISTFTDLDVDIGQARIFTLRGGDIVMWSSNGNIAAGSAPRTVVTAPPTRVVVDVSSASIQTDLGGLATGGGIGVLAAVEGVKPGNVDLIAPKGFVDAGDAGIRVTGNLNIAAQVVLNSSNISVAGNTSGSSVAVSSAPSVSVTTSAASASAAATSAAPKSTEERPATETAPVADQGPSLFTVEVIGYGGGAADEEDEDKEETSSQPEATE